MTTLTRKGHGPGYRLLTDGLKATAIATATVLFAWAAVAQTGAPGKPTDLSPSTGQQYAPPKPGGAGAGLTGQRAQTTAPGGKAAEENKEPSPETKAAVIRVRDSAQIMAKEVIGSKVVGKDGKEIGKVEDLIFDQNGQLSGVVISSGGILGIGSKSIGVNKEAVDIGSAKEQEVVFVNIMSTEISKVPPIMQPAKPRNVPSGAGASRSGTE